MPPHTRHYFHIIAAITIIIIVYFMIYVIPFYIQPVTILRLFIPLSFAFLLFTLASDYAYCATLTHMPHYQPLFTPLFYLRHLAHCYYITRYCRWKIILCLRYYYAHYFSSAIGAIRLLMPLRHYAAADSHAMPLLRRDIRHACMLRPITPLLLFFTHTILGHYAILLLLPRIDHAIHYDYIIGFDYHYCRYAHYYFHYLILSPSLPAAYSLRHAIMNIITPYY